MGLGEIDSFGLDQRISRDLNQRKCEILIEFFCEKIQESLDYLDWKVWIKYFIEKGVGLEGEERGNALMREMEKGRLEGI